MQPLRLLHVAPSLGMGGREARMATLFDAMGDAFHHDVIALDGCVDFLDRVRDRRRVSVLPPPGTTHALARAQHILSNLKDRSPSVLLTYNWGAIDAVVAALLRPSVALVHTEDGFAEDEANGPLRRRILARRVLLRRADAVVAISERLATLAMHTYCLPEHRIHLIRNGVDVTTFAPGTSDWRTRKGIPRDALLLGAVGRLSPEKNIRLMLTAFARLHTPGVHLAVVGDGPDAASLRHLARSLGVGSRVHFTGYETDTASSFRAFDVFLLSSLTEQAPIALLEAMATELPVLCTDVGDCRAMIGSDGRAAQVTPAADADAYVSALQRLVDSPALRRQLAVSNRRHVERSFSHAAMIEAHRTLYTRLATHGRS